MSKFENPIQFDINKEVEGVKISYSNLMEIVQGGPEVGTISINETPVQLYRFGGPCLKEEGYVYAPAFVKKFFGSGFKLAQINIQTLKVKLLGKTKDLIFIDRIESGRIYFFEDVDKTISKYYDLDKE